VPRNASAEVMLAALFMVRVDAPLAENAPVPANATVPPVMSCCPSNAKTVPVAKVILPVKVDEAPRRVTVPLLIVVVPEIVSGLLANETEPELVLLKVKFLKVCVPLGKGKVPKGPLPLMTKSVFAPEMVILLPFEATFPFKVRDLTVAVLTMFKSPFVKIKSLGINIMVAPELPVAAVVNDTPLVLSISVITVPAAGWPLPIIWALSPA